MTPLRRASILIVEDNVLVAMELEDAVSRLGYRVMGPFHNLADGSAAVQLETPDFALLDFDLGDGLDSIPIAETLSANQVPFAFISGTDPAVIHASMPNTPVVGKPMDEAALTKLLRPLA